MNSETGTDIKQLRAELMRLREDLGKLTGTLERTARHGAAEASHSLHATIEGLRDDASRTAHGVAREIEHNPVTGALAAFGVGVALGMLLNGRR